jgi:hypothetical protein
MMMSEKQARELEASRGDQDVDPRNCWAEWQGLRAELASKLKE